MKIVFHVPELTRVNACFNNINNYLKSDDLNKQAILYVIFNGDAVKALCQSQTNAKHWQQLASDNQRLILQVCHNSLRSLTINQDELISHVQIIPAAVVGLIKLQQEGCIYLRP